MGCGPAGTGCTCQDTKNDTEPAQVSHQDIPGGAFASDLADVYYSQRLESPNPDHNHAIITSHTRTQSLARTNSNSSPRYDHSSKSNESLDVDVWIPTDLVRRYVHQLFTVAERSPSNVAQLLALFSHDNVPPVLRRRAGELGEVIKSTVERVTSSGVAVEAVMVTTDVEIVNSAIFDGLAI